MQGILIATLAFKAFITAHDKLALRLEQKNDTQLLFNNLVHASRQTMNSLLATAHPFFAQYGYGALFGVALVSVALAVIGALRETLVPAVQRMREIRPAVSEASSATRFMIDLLEAP